MVWWGRFLSRRQLRKLVPALAADLKKNYGSAATYSPGQVLSGMQRIKTPARLAPILMAGMLGKEACLQLSGSMAAEDYDGFRQQFRDLMPFEWWHEHWIMTDEHTLRDFNFRNSD